MNQYLGEEGGERGEGEIHVVSEHDGEDGGRERNIYIQ